jgi:UDP-3-O-[3-hydroxymyristoyl] glucosamine N-acyltransferase
MACYTALELSKRVGGELLGSQTMAITGLASLSLAKAGQLACVFHEKQWALLPHTKASCLLIGQDLPPIKLTSTLIKVNLPIESFSLLMPLFEDKESVVTGIDKTAQIGEATQIGEGCYIGPNTRVGKRVSLGRHVRIAANAVIADDVSIGDNSSIGAHVFVGEKVRLGCSVHIDIGAVLGAHPFNVIKTKGVWSQGKICGGLIIGNNVSIGANTVIARGTHADTLIEAGVKIDNLVQVAHDVIIGAHSVVVACAAIGANTAIGDHCSIGGGASIAGNLTITEGVFITGTAIVTRSVRQEGIYSSGTTIEPHKKWRKNVARFHRLDLMALRLKRLEKKLESSLESVE